MDRASKRRIIARGVVCNVRPIRMSNKKIYRYTNVELLDLIKNGPGQSKVEEAKIELEKRKLSVEEMKIVEADYTKFKEYQEKRIDEPLTREEWLSFFILPFITPRPQWRKNDHFSESEYQRFEKYGFVKKARQASEARAMGAIFWVIIIVLVMVATRWFN